MNKMVSWCVGLSILLSSSAARATDESDIRGKADAFEVAWNMHDAKAMVAIWASDGDFIDAFGNGIFTGAGDVEKLLGVQFKGFLSQSKLMESYRRVRISGGKHLGMLDLDVTVSNVTAASGAVDLKMHISFALEKANNVWAVQGVREAIFSAQP